MTCQFCNFSFQSVDDTVVLNGEYPSLYCPMCGRPHGEWRSKGVLYDAANREFLLWEGAADPKPVGGLRVVIHGIVTKIQDCFYERIAFFERADPDQVCPIRLEKRHLIARWRLVRGGKGHKGAVYEVATPDGHTAQAHCDCVTVPNPDPPVPGRGEASLLVWPKFRLRLDPALPQQDMAGWRRYYVGFNPPSVPGHGEISRILAGGQVRLVGDLYAQPDLPPECIEVAWRNDLDHLTYYAAMLPKLEDRQPVAADRVRIGFDFGTTNTAGAIRLVRAGGGRHPSLITISDLTADVIPGKLSVDNTWLPRPTEEARSLPSQLLFTNGHSDAELITKELLPTVNYTIPWSQEDREDTLSVGRFKWQDTMPVHLHHKTDVLRFLYLKLALEVFLAQAVWEHRISGEVHFVATFPLAYGPAGCKLHEESFTEALKHLETYTPFRFLGDFEWNESHAGEIGAKAMDEIQELVIVDVGGGTTDLSVSAVLPELKVLQQDSFRYGGEDVNAAVLPVTNHWSMAMLQYQIRTKGAGVLAREESFRLGASGRRQTRRLLEHFRIGLVELCARLLAARLQAVWKDADANFPPVFGLLMLGNGWRFLEPLAQGNLEDYVSQEVGRRLEEYRRAGLISRLPDRIKTRHPEDPKGAVALGAAQAHELGDKPPSANPESYMFLNMKMNVGRTPRSAGWTTTIPLKLDAALHSFMLDGAQQFGFQEERLVLPDGVAIDRLEFKDLCVPDPEANNSVVRSPFAFYLEFYAKGLASALAKETNA